MSSILVGVPPKRFRLPHKVGGPSQALRPAAPTEYLTPGQKRRRLDAAYLERFFAREQRRLATGGLSSTERETIRLPKRGRVSSAVAQALGLMRNPQASKNDPEATHWIPHQDLSRLQYSPFRAKAVAQKTSWPHLGKPLLSPLKYRRLWMAARRQGLDHLLPLGPQKAAEAFQQREARREEAIGLDDTLLTLASQHWGRGSGGAVDTPERVDTIMRNFAVTLPKYQRSTPSRLFQLGQIKLERRRAKAEGIVQAMEGMPQKIAEYRKAQRANKVASLQSSPL